MTKPVFITAQAFCKALFDAGLLADYDTCERVIIDAKVGEALRVYVSRIGEKRLVDVIVAGGIEIIDTEAPA